jgi:hypothetical protein
MRFAHLVWWLAACAPGLKQPDAHVQTRGVLVDASGNAVAIERLMKGAVMEGGLWFADAACAEQFSRDGEIHPDRFHAFAACLATLHWQASPREDAFGDSVVLNYSPGLEIEAVVAQELSGPRLLWIGYRRDWDQALPTIVPEVLEGLREAGERVPNLPRAVGDELQLDAAPGARSAHAWFRICLDASGAVTSAEERETTSPTASRVFGDVVASWRFRPFIVDGKAIPVCSLVRLIYPRTHMTDKEWLPLPPPPSRRGKKPIMLAPGAKVVEAKRIEGERRILPDERTRSAMADAGISQVAGAFRVCLDETGHVESVLPLKSTGFATYDRELLAGINRWVYSPFVVNGEPAPVCTAVNFVYSQSR